MSLIQRLLKPIVELRKEEAGTVALMFLYSFLTMVVWNTLKPATRSTFIQSLGAENLPYVLLAAGFVIAFIMQGYSRAVSLLPKKAVIPVAQAVLAGLMVVFFLLFQTGHQAVSVVFFLFGQILGILLISQFWTLANDIFDPRQAKRVFGFIGGGASLGGIVGSLLATQAKAIGTFNLLLVSAATMVACIVVVTVILRRNRDVELASIASAGEEKGVGAGEAIRLLRSSKHLQIIAAVIAFAAIGAGLIEQQLNMAAQAFQGREADGLTSFLGQVQLYTSTLGFIIQIWLVSKIQRHLGVGFALLMLPVSLGVTGGIILLNAALWAPALARVLDTSLRYTVDKTTREILFLPLSSEIKYQAKPFVDVTVDRMGKAASALLALVLIAPWGLQLDWAQISYASLGVTGLWIFTAVAAKRGYLSAFRQSIERRDVVADDVRITQADLQTIETLVEELSDPDEQRVLYAIDILETLEKRNLVTPLLLQHESPRVRARALAALGASRPDAARRWLPRIERLLTDGDPGVRAAAIGALANIQEASAVALARPFIADRDQRLAATAATVLARSADAEDADLALRTLTRLATDPADATSQSRRDVAAAVSQIRDPRFNHLLIPLLYDQHAEVSEEAMRAVKALATTDYLFVPTLVSLLRDRRLKGPAREVLIGYGEGVVDTLAYFLEDEQEDIWVRRHIPATLAHIPGQRTLDVLMAALPKTTDGFLRYKLLTAIERVHRAHPDLTFDRKVFEQQTLSEAMRYYRILGLHDNLVHRAGLPADGLLPRVLDEKLRRGKDRLFSLLALQYPWRDIEATRWALERGDARTRSSALEYLDNLLSAAYRRRLLPMFEEMPLEERVRRANVLANTRPRDLEETLLQLINDEDEVVAAAAIYTAAQQKQWGLADDIEHVLAHRDAKDWYVFEAASWALAERRLSEEKRRALWLEPLPAVEVVSRLATLPLFEATSADELFRIATVGRQVRHEAGKVLVQEGAVATDLLVLLDGQVTVGAEAGVQDAPRFLVFGEAMEATALPATVRSRTPVVVLSLSADQWRTLLSDSSRLVLGLFRTILEQPRFAEERTLLRGRPSEELARLADEGITPIEKVLILQQIPSFARVSGEEVLRIADRARRRSFAEGDRLFAEGDMAAIHVVASGALALEADGHEPIEAVEGDVIGFTEALAGVPLGRAGRATRGGAALVISHQDLYDVLEERPNLLQPMLTVFLGAQATPAPPVARTTSQPLPVA
jgi:ATP:ADP antiporter, AAA family